jgi:Family of unknown function (DUF5330)
MDKNDPTLRTRLSAPAVIVRTKAAMRAAGDLGLMFFLLRLAFWLGLVLVLLPTGSAQHGAANGEVHAADALSAASATVHDLRGFCAREPNACSVGSEFATSMGYRAQAGAKMLYEFLSEVLAPRETGSLGRDVGAAPSGKAAPLRDSQNTLTPADLAPAWHGPAPRKDRRPPV